MELFAMAHPVCMTVIIVAIITFFTIIYWKALD